MSNNYYGLAWVASTALFMQTLDATILNTALPSIAADLQESPLEMQLAVISYALTVALLIPLSGWLADRFGTLVVFRAAIALFTLGSICCSFAGDLNSLVAFRVLQGAGGALMMPVARLSIIKSVPRHEVLSVWNMMVMAGLIGPIMGPVLGGWLVTYASWHWIFLMNIPIGIVGFWLCGRYMPNLTGKIFRLDWLGFLLFGGALAGVTLGLDMIGSRTFSLWSAIVVLLLGMLLFVGYYHYARHVSQPLLGFSLFQYRTFNIGTQVNLVLRLCGSGAPFLLPLMLQVAYGYPADIAGWMLTPIALSSILCKPMIRSWLNRFGYKKALIAATVLLCGSLVCFGLMQPSWSLWWLLPPLVLYGCAMSLLFTATNTLTISEFSEENNSEGSTLLSVTQQVGLGLGIAFAAVVLNIYRTLLAPDAVAQAFSYTFFTVATIGILQIIVLLKLQAHDGENMSRREG
ncbi:DHA2 family efflux MFS transporter permease subunit [Pasteurellaceae bacterium USgator11]|nr:DHA2 family efflux MFS transporter permease subunit [Pasteurellaceae bacterium USgator41]TNG96134.1 DHA2 family efflux MFS transporter permease subunit [Pasteurellaceae bacterium UScroc12]TNG98436.1 DHA2 family efflux MFS transporter permease subunit [Pasteurellaceae bacterium UScroc31]TNH02717.1 DHA2 family efflux MFS transporter permease subunit [Pasteurellaceae bacterium USgator11]